MPSRVSCASTSTSTAEVHEETSKNAGATSNPTSPTPGSATCPHRTIQEALTEAHRTAKDLFLSKLASDHPMSRSPDHPICPSLPITPSTIQVHPSPHFNQQNQALSQCLSSKQDGQKAVQL